MAGRALRWGTVALILGAFAAEAAAELLNIELDGHIRMRGRYFRNAYDENHTTPGSLRIPDQLLERRPIGPWGTRSIYNWDSRGADRDYVEQSVRLGARASLTEDVQAYIEFKTYHVWSNDFRADWITGEDFGPGDRRPVNLHQAYIDVSNLFTDGLRLRIGRQRLELGKGWHISSRRGIIDRSYDGVRVTYDQPLFRLDAWAMKLWDSRLLEQDGDADLYTVEGTYKGLDAADVSLYWILARDPRRIQDTNFTFAAEWLEDLLGLDDYGTTVLHTFGLRIHGETGPWDYDLEAALQRGNAARVGSLFRSGLYGDNRARFDGNWATDVEAGYTFDTAWTPRVFLGGAYFSGEDNRDLSFLDWLNPFYRPEASVSFNRLYSFFSYSFLKDLPKGMTNFHQVRGGFQAHPTDRVTLDWELAYFGVNDTFDLPRHFRLGRHRVPIAPGLSFWTQPAASDIGWLSHFILRYQYTEDVNFNLGWERLFTGKAMRDGSFTHRNGLEFMGGTAQKDADLFYFDTQIRF